MSVGGLLGSTEARPFLRFSFGPLVSVRCRSESPSFARMYLYAHSSSSAYVRRRVLSKEYVNRDPLSPLFMAEIAISSLRSRTSSVAALNRITKYRSISFSPYLRKKRMFEVRGGFRLVLTWATKECSSCPKEWILSDRRSEYQALAALRSVAGKPMQRRASVAP